MTVTNLFIPIKELPISKVDDNKISLFSSGIQHQNITKPGQAKIKTVASVLQVSKTLLGERMNCLDQLLYLYKQI